MESEIRCSMDPPHHKMMEMMTIGRGQRRTEQKSKDDKSLENFGQPTTNFPIQLYTILW